MEIRNRVFTIEGLKLRDVKGASVVEGHAALFDTLSEPLWELGGAKEKIDPGAFADTIQSDDIRALINHDPSQVLGRNKAGTLSLREDDKGLFFQVKLPSTSFARDLVESMRRGDINQNSFGFTVNDQKWEKQDGEDISVLKSVRLFDVSVVTFPAYTETLSEVRSIAQALTREKPTDEDRKRIKEFGERCQQACGAGLLTSDSGDRNGGPAPCGCGQRHAAEDVDIALAREIRRREIELFELDA
jgi:Escherichia/Staphylococcus phage prohead protease